MSGYQDLTHHACVAVALFEKEQGVFAREVTNRSNHVGCQNLLLMAGEPKGYWRESQRAIGGRAKGLLAANGGRAKGLLAGEAKRG